MTLKLIYFGRAHSGSGILIHVPEEGILLTGDLFLDQNWLPLFADQMELDVPMWIEALHLVLDGETQVKHVIPGHKRSLDTGKTSIVEGLHCQTVERC